MTLGHLLVYYVVTTIFYNAKGEYPVADRAQAIIRARDAGMG